MPDPASMQLSGWTEGVGDKELATVGKGGNNT